ncbi:MAG: hypothetical protein WC449_06250 [Candidatus Paceibacterota bacterium]
MKKSKENKNTYLVIRYRPDGKDDYGKVTSRCKKEPYGIGFRTTVGDKSYGCSVEIPRNAKVNDFMRAFKMLAHALGCPQKVEHRARGPNDTLEEVGEMKLSDYDKVIGT